MVRILLILLLGYLLLVMALYLWQRSLLYFPATYRPSDEQLQSLGLTPWPQDEWRGYLGEPKHSDAKGTVLVFHGNAGSAWQRDYFAKALTARGYRVLLAEYPGYGGRAGKPSERTLVQDALQTLSLARQTFSGPVYLWGESLGAAVTAAMTAQLGRGDVDGLVLQSPWRSLAELASHHYWYLPVDWLLRDRFDSQTHLQDFASPVAVLVAGQDEIVPVSFSLSLYQQLSAPKRLWRFSQSGHNNLPLQADADWFDEVMEFLATGGKSG
ncbi:alpha/beta hydrolase [Bowmanella dokdonensis]|uniref:Alpha/beta fold hydrolase n=1 Tax=Bowmanella dokdonensis TaxID=751969 RepID=A0A939IM63_9ALTE|nr:alpha/beta fold hydrolase [Bowmanella dokdonensis]MBN7824968.1 alpha/beta fold hydrolase [Bowmanella dokdonensis]